MTAGTLPAILTALAVVALPGAAATAACMRRARVGVPTVLVTTLALGYAVAGGVAVALAAVRHLSHTSFLACLALVTVVLGAIGLRTGLPVVGRRWRRARRVPRLETLAGLLVVGFVAAERLRFDPVANLSGAGRWRYWADAREVAVLGRFPDTVHQWGAAYAPTAGKAYLNAFSGALSYLVGASAVPAYGALLWLSAVGLAAALWALAHELGFRRTAPLAPLIAFEWPLGGGWALNESLGVGSSIYKAEDMGRWIAIAALALGIRAVRRPSHLRPAVLSGLLLGVASSTHAVAALVAAAALGSYVAACALTTRSLRSTIRPVGATALATLAVAVAVPVAAGGTLGYGGVTGGRYTPAKGHLDPTAAFAEKRLAFETDRDGFRSSRELIHAYVTAAVGATAPIVAPVALAVIALAAAAAAWRFQAPPLARIAVTGLLLAGVLFLLGLAFNLLYDQYIPATFGQRRLFPYASIPLVLIGLAYVEWAMRLLARWRAPVSRAATAVLVIGAAIGVHATLEPIGREPSAQALTASMRAIHESVPCGARILPNRRSNATFEALSGRESVLEGMAPYLRPRMLQRVLAQIAAARAFFRDPGHGWSFLRREQIGYVAVIRDSGSWPKHGRSFGRFVRTEVLDTVPFLTPIHREYWVTVYRVRGIPATRRPAPGFDCRAPTPTA